MSNYYRDIIFPYTHTMLQAKILLRDGIITADEYDCFEEEMRDKYSLDKKSLFRMKSVDITEKQR